MEAEVRAILASAVGHATVPENLVDVVRLKGGGDVDIKPI